MLGLNFDVLGIGDPNKQESLDCLDNAIGRIAVTLELVPLNRKATQPETPKLAMRSNAGDRAITLQSLE